jgi:hypothetical protein
VDEKNPTLSCLRVAGCLAHPAAGCPFAYSICGYHFNPANAITFERNSVQISIQTPAMLTEVSVIFFGHKSGTSKIEPSKK